MPREDSIPAHGGGASPAQDEPLEVFIAYSRKDEDLREALEEGLKSLERRGHIKSYWYDAKIAPGDEWQKEIDRRIRHAHIILLLISYSFLASDYCHDVELTKAMKRHKAGEAIVIPVILRRCNWREYEFAELQALPSEGKPVEEWPIKAAAIYDIDNGIRRAIEKLRSTSRKSRVGSPR
jgi:hypothetical protein